jgi:hypothetical protein
MKTLKKVQKEVEKIKLEIEKIQVIHNQLNQIDMLSKEGSILRQRKHECEGKLLAFKWLLEE